MSSDLEADANNRLFLVLHATKSSSKKRRSFLVGVVIRPVIITGKWRCCFTMGVPPGTAMSSVMKADLPISNQQGMQGLGHSTR